MPDYLLNSGLPASPAGLSDRDYALVGPLYAALAAMAQTIAALNGAVQYSQYEMQNMRQTAGLINKTQNKLVIKATETLSYGKLVNLYAANDTYLSGSPQKLHGRLATNYASDGTTRPALAYVDNPNGIASGQYGEVIFMTGHTYGISGATMATPYYLSTGGLVQAAQPADSGRLIQIVGIGMGTFGFYVDISATLTTAAAWDGGGY